jgi:hypothetical protein
LYQQINLLSTAGSSITPADWYVVTCCAFLVRATVIYGANADHSALGGRSAATVSAEFRKFSVRAGARNAVLGDVLLPSNNPFNNGGPVALRGLTARWSRGKDARWVR